MKIKKEINKVKKVIKERKFFYLIAYLIGYAVSLMGSGVPNKIYLIPIKLWGIIMAIGIGNALYHAAEKEKFLPHERLVKFLKHITIIMIIVIIFGWIKDLFLQLGIDISFLI